MHIAFINSYSAYLLPFAIFKSKLLSCNNCNQCTHNCDLRYGQQLTAPPLGQVPSTLNCRAAKSCHRTYSSDLFCSVRKTNHPGYLHSVVPRVVSGDAGRTTSELLSLSAVSAGRTAPGRAANESDPCSLLHFCKCSWCNASCCTCLPYPSTDTP